MDISLLNSSFLVLLFLLLSGFFSVSEAIYHTHNALRLEKDPKQKLKDFMEQNPLEQCLANILLAKELFSILAAMTIGLYFLKTGEALSLASLPLIAASITIALVLILVSVELFPKILGRRFPELFISAGIPLLAFYFKIFAPADKILKGARHATSGLMETIFPKKHTDRLSEEDLLTIIEAGETSGVIDEDEAELVQNVLQFGDTRVSKVMTPFGKVHCIPEEATMEHALNEYRSTNYSRIPAYKNARENITGILFAKNLITRKFSKNGENGKHTVKNIMTAPFYTNETTRANDLFLQMKKVKTHMAIVKNRKDETVGIITLEDLLEELFGEIHDERD